MRRGVRWIVFGVFLALSVALTVLLWPRGAFLFLVFPFLLPWRGGRPSPPSRVCARCGWATQDREARFCPRDGEPL